MKHITGNHPTREITEAEAIERDEPRFLVLQEGEEIAQITVHGDGLSRVDAEEAAEEWLEDQGIIPRIVAVTRLPRLSTLTPEAR